ncbi:DUF6551 family protein [Streptomyces sp. NPDC048224]|uniref:DUF6551 family protein n=1 Tax=Streptomyces sp. NPDC048224 TaxID=3154500 RepID=UPI0033F69410
MTMTRAQTQQLKKYYAALPVGQLQVDDEMDAQRIFDPGWANKLAKMWDPEVLLVATVSKRADGSYFLIDGQHSTRVAEQKEGPEFVRDCMVYEGLTRQQEAKLFLAANKQRKPVKPYDNFKVSITAGDPLSIRIDKEVRSCGLEVASGTSTNRVGAVQALVFVGEKREGLVPKVLTTLGTAWGRDKASWDNIAIRAVGLIYDTNWDVVQDARLVKTLQKATVAIWKMNAIRTTVSGGGSASRAVPLAENIITQYNSGLRDPKKLLVSPARSVNAA